MCTDKYAARGKYIYFQCISVQAYISQSSLKLKSFLTATFFFFFSVQTNSICVLILEDE